MRSLPALLALVTAAVLMRALILRIIRSQPPANSKPIIRIKNGRCEFASGSIDTLGRQQVEGLIQEAGVRAGLTALAENRVHFAPPIPASLHQRFQALAERVEQACRGLGFAT